MKRFTVRWVADREVDGEVEVAVEVALVAEANVADLLLKALHRTNRDVDRLEKKVLLLKALVSSTFLDSAAQVAQVALADLAALEALEV